jgi:predicted nucleic acid-binding protein
MFLVDTSVWLESLLQHQNAPEVKAFLDHTPSHLLSITDFTFHSLGIILTRLKKADVLLRFVQDLFVDGAVLLVRLGPEHMSRLIEVSSQFNLDFDDANQYVAAELRGLVIVSFDGDFDRTLLGRKTPAQVLGMNA